MHTLNHSPTAMNEQIDILLVDDREENLFTLSAVLNSPDYQVIQTRSGDEALRYLLKNEPAVILMDVEMPELDGFETARIIKGSNRTRDIPIIFVTALNKDDRFAHKGYAHGAVDYVYKPYDALILKSKVAVFADLAKKNRRLFQAERQIRLTEQKERERQLAQLELKSLRREAAHQKKYLDLVDGISHGIVWSAHTDSFNISFVGPSATKLFGFPIDRWTNEPAFFLKHVHPDDFNKTRENFEKVITDKTYLDFEHRMIKADGSEIWLHTGIRVAAQGDEGDHEIRGLSIDITKIKEAEEVLRENKRKADFLAEASLVMSESLDSDTTISKIRELIVPHFADSLGFYLLDSNEVLMNFDQPGSSAGQEVNQVFRIGASEFDFRQMLVPLSIRGSTFGVMAFRNEPSSRAFNKNDLSLMEDLARRVSVAVDNSRLYQHAKEAIAARDEFLSIASHELKTPLTPLKLQIQILMRTLKNHLVSEIKPEKINQILQTSDRQIEKLASLIDGLMDISRISNGKLQLEPDSFDATALMKEIVERFSNEASIAKCEVSFDSSKPLMVCLDPFRIEQVLVNLLSNAIKYGAGKPVHISLKTSGKQLLVSVRDHGGGIAPKDQKRIFERFERAVTGNTVSGLGLGLYIVKQIIERHGGTIEVASELGKGSTFKVSLPVDVTATLAASLEATIQ